MAEVSGEKIGLLCSRSGSQQRFKLWMNVCMNNSFLTAECSATLLKCCITSTLIVVQKDLFAVLKVKVRVRAHKNYSLTFGTISDSECM